MEWIYTQTKMSNQGSLELVLIMKKKERKKELELIEQIPRVPWQYRPWPCLFLETCMYSLKFILFKAILTNFFVLSEIHDHE